MNYTMMHGPTNIKSHFDLSTWITSVKFGRNFRYKNIISYVNRTKFQGKSNRDSEVKVLLRKPEIWGQVNKNSQLQNNVNRVSELQDNFNGQFEDKIASLNILFYYRLKTQHITSTIRYNLRN
jgi:hypothetical protein